ncbi:MAG: OB-fold nucleic acid binding domain-containing protein [Candidatus Altiarchaeota archaeon]|nr:OB-fold nucleic acid binding domain-containing protein [Candidatus Altiarchaeota archaeon]
MESKFLYLSLLLSITGLLILAYTTETIEPPISKIEDVHSFALGKNVHLQGNITSIHRFEGGSMLIKLGDGVGEITVYLPYTTASRFREKLRVNTSLDLVGVVELYNGNLEVVVENHDALEVCE